MSCKALTTKGSPCTRERMNDTIPYCWQHSRKLLEELMWGLDKMRDEEGELTPDDLTPEQVIEHFNNSARRIEELEEELRQCNLDRLRRTDCDCETLEAALEQCQQSLTRAQGNATVWSMANSQCQDELARCREEQEILERALDDCEEELDDSQLMPEEMPDGGTSEEGDPSDSGTFPDDLSDDSVSEGEASDADGDEPVGVLLDPVVFSPIDLDDLDVFGGLTDEQMFSLEPEGSVGLFHCTEEEAVSMSGRYDTMGRKRLIGDARTLAKDAGDNFLNEYFQTYGKEDAWDERAAGAWVKPGDWFFFRNSLDDKWYGSPISKATYHHHPSDYSVLEFEDMDMVNLGEGVEFVIIIFAA